MNEPTTLEQAQNVRAVLDAAEAELTAAGISPARAAAALADPRYRRRTTAGRVWRNARPWLAAAYQADRARAQLADLTAELERDAATLAAMGLPETAAYYHCQAVALRAQEAQS